jgi:hypothetical protein
MPREGDVMRIAERWGICPFDIPDDSVNSPGIYGVPAGAE